MEYINKNNIKSAKILPPTEEPEWQKHGWQVALNMGEYCLYIDRNSKEECEILTERLNLVKI